MIKVVRDSICTLLLYVMGGFGQVMSQPVTSHPAVYSILPGWVFQHLPDLPRSVRMLGISDPGLPFNVARQQAFLRGVALGSLATASTGSFLSDLFSMEEQNENQSRYEEIYQVFAIFFVDPQHVTVLEEATLKSGEVILLMDVPVENDSTTQGEKLIADLFLYNNEVNASQKNQLMRKYTFSLNLDRNDRTFPMDDFSFFRLNRKASGIRTMMLQSQRSFDSLEYYYGMHSLNETDSALVGNGDRTTETMNEEEHSPTNCSSGLWIAYLSQILEQASFFIQHQVDNTARVSDHTANLTIDLSREAEVVPLQWRIHRFRLNGQEASIWIQFHTIDSP